MKFLKSIQRRKSSTSQNMSTGLESHDMTKRRNMERGCLLHRRASHNWMLISYEFPSQSTKSLSLFRHWVSSIGKQLRLNLRIKEVLRFRDHAFQVYFSNPRYLDM